MGLVSVYSVHVQHTAEIMESKHYIQHPQAPALCPSPPKQGISSLGNELNLLLKIKLNKEKKSEKVLGFVSWFCAFLFFKHTMTGTLKELLHTFGYR